jgi:hypothetical protein
MPDLSTTSRAQGNWSTLSDLMDPIAPLGPVADMEISEVTGAIEEGEAVGRTNSASAAHMLFAIDAEYVQNSNKFEQVLKSLMGGYWQGEKRTPMSYPYLSGLYCTDVHSKLTAMIGGQTLDGSGLLQTYQRAVLSLEFRSLPYNVEPDISNKWITFERFATNQRIGAPANDYIFNGGPEDTKAASSTVYYTTGLTYIVMQVHQVSHDLLFPDGDFISVLDSSVGYVNSTSMGGFNPETLLLDSIKVDDCYRDYANAAATDSRMYAPILNFCYAPNGWNKIRASDAMFYPVKSRTGGNPPFVSKNLSDVIQQIEESWSA